MFSAHCPTLPYSLIPFNFAASLCHWCFKRRRGPITALCNVPETEDVHTHIHADPSHTHTHTHTPLSVNKGFFYSWVTKHDPIIPKLDSKLKNPPPPATPLPSLLLYPFLPLSEDFIRLWQSGHTCVYVACSRRVGGGGVTNTSTLSFDYSNYDSERGVDYYEHMGRRVVDELTSLQLLHVTVTKGLYW